MSEVRWMPTPELTALYHLHRFQVVLHAKDRTGEYRFPPAYLYAVAHGIYPQFHPSWGAESDPFLSLYRVKKEFMNDLVSYLEGFAGQSVLPAPAFYALERKYAGQYREELIGALRYLHLSGRFGTEFFLEMLSTGAHIAEAAHVNSQFSEQELDLMGTAAR